MNTIRPRALVAALLLMLIVASGDGRIRPPEPDAAARKSAAMTAEFRANFLDLGEGPRGGRGGDEMACAEPGWISPSKGVVTAWLWNVPALIAFERSDEHEISILKIQPTLRSGSPDTWELWRHRHGYTYHHERGYSWNAMEEERTRLDRAEGEFYDDYLQRLWLHWAQQRLGRALSKGTIAVPTGPSLSGPLLLPVEITWDDGGVIGRVPIAFTLRLWGTPVHVHFDLQGAEASSGRAVEVRDGYQWTYDRHEWRRRHGYEKRFWTGYAWQDGFPADGPLTDEQGRRLDRLLDHAVSHWVAAAVHGVVADLDRKTRSAIASAQ